MLAAVAVAVCVGVVALAWVAGALYNAFRSPNGASYAPRERPPNEPGLTAGDGGLIGVAVVCVSREIVGRGHFDDLAVGALWVRVVGLAVLVASTVLTLWAPFSLGTLWSVAPKVKGDQLLSEIGQSIVLFLVALLVFEVKIRMEARLMVVTFPNQYSRCRAAACPRSSPARIYGVNAT